MKLKKEGEKRTTADTENEKWQIVSDSAEAERAIKEHDR